MKLYYREVINYSHYLYERIYKWMNERIHKISWLSACLRENEIGKYLITFLPEEISPSIINPSVKGLLNWLLIRFLSAQLEPKSRKSKLGEVSDTPRVHLLVTRQQVNQINTCVNKYWMKNLSWKNIYLLFS